MGSTFAPRSDVGGRPVRLPAVGDIWSYEDRCRGLLVMLVRATLTTTIMPEFEYVCIGLIGERRDDIDLYIGRRRQAEIREGLDGRPGPEGNEWMWKLVSPNGGDA